MMDVNSILALMNLGVCSVAGFLIVCRMVKMSHDGTKLVIRWQYVLMFVAFAASGWSFLFGSSPGPMHIIANTCFTGSLALGTNAWRYGAPLYTRREGHA